MSSTSENRSQGILFENLKLIRAIGFIFLLAALVHFGFLIVFYLHKIPILTIWNLGAPLLYVGCHFLARKEKFYASFYLTFTEVLIHSSLATAILGWNSGFYLYLFLLFLLIFFMPGKNAILKISAAVLVSATIIFLFFESETTVLAINIDQSFIRGLHLFNIFAIILVLSSFSYIYSSTYNHAEEILLKSEKDLKVLNDSKDRFFSIIAHDLKNPFNSLLGLLELMVSRYDKMTDERKKEILSKILEFSGDTYKLLINLLEWSRSQLGEIRLNLENAEIEPLISEEIKMMTSMLEKKRIKIRSEISPELKGYFDSDMIRTVFRNLLSNAVKFSYEGGIIDISGRNSDAGRIEISFSDKGIGMTQQDAEKIFDFTQVTRNAGTFNEQGTGLGLLVCREFVRKNKGNIIVKSKPGEGSEFTIFLPAAV